MNALSRALPRRTQGGDALHGRRGPEPLGPPPPVWIPVRKHVPSDLSSLPTFGPPCGEPLTPTLAPAKKLRWGDEPSHLLLCPMWSLCAPPLGCNWTPSLATMLSKGALTCLLFLLGDSLPGGPVPLCPIYVVLSPSPAPPAPST